MPTPQDQAPSRGASAAGSTAHRPTIKNEREPSRRSQGSGAARQLPPEPQYIVYIRLPFNRNGFVDPPRVCGPCAPSRSRVRR